MIIYILTGIVMGLIFGLALEKGRVFEPGMIVGQFQLRNFIMLRMFLAAIATSLLAISLMFAFGLVELHPKAAVFPATIFGGLLFGAGMALTGACPGTALAQIGAGYRDAWAVVAGSVFGAMTYGYMEPFMSGLSSSLGSITVSDTTGISYAILAPVLAVVLILVLFVMERWRPWREELGEDYDGHFIADEVTS